MTQNARPRYGTPRWVKWFAGIVVVLIVLVVVVAIFAEGEDSDDDVPAAPTATASAVATTALEAYRDAQKRCGASGMVPRWSNGMYQCVAERRSQPRAAATPRRSQPRAATTPRPPTSPAGCEAAKERAMARVRAIVGSGYSRISSTCRQSPAVRNTLVGEVKLTYSDGCVEVGWVELRTGIELDYDSQRVSC